MIIAESIAPLAGAVLAWLATYAVHSTLLLGGVWLLTRRVVRSDSWRDVLWKAALVGGIFTATTHLLAEWTPPAGRFDLVAPLGAVSDVVASVPSLDPPTSHIPA